MSEQERQELQALNNMATYNYYMTERQLDRHQELSVKSKNEFKLPPVRRDQLRTL